MPSPPLPRSSETFAVSSSLALLGRSGSADTNLLGVVKDDAERVASAARDSADPVADGGAVIAARARHRAVARGEDEHLALVRGDGLAARLRTRALLHE